MCPISIRSFHPSVRLSRFSLVWLAIFHGVCTSYVRFVPFHVLCPLLKLATQASKRTQTRIVVNVPHVVVIVVFLVIVVIVVIVVLYVIVVVVVIVIAVFILYNCLPIGSSLKSQETHQFSREFFVREVIEIATLETMTAMTVTTTTTVARSGEVTKLATFYPVSHRLLFNGIAIHF